MAKHTSPPKPAAPGQIRGPRRTAARRSGRRAVVAVGGLAIVIAVIALIVVSGGTDSANEATLSPAATTGDVGAEPTPVTFLSDDAHQDLPATPGCDQLAFHSAMAMWNPSYADEMLGLGCPFPFEPDTVSMEGGAEDPTIEAPFEPRRYEEVYDVLTAQRLGMCAVQRLGEPSVRGFVYGFSTTVKAGGCADNDPDLEIFMREYATRPHRDEAANAAAGTVDRTLVLGRWTIVIDGDDEAAASALANELEVIGAAPLAGD